jgi:hypothetical protein
MSARFCKRNSNGSRLPSSAASQPVSVAGLSVALRGQTRCGDDWSVRHAANGAAILVVDGLGHGDAAHDAARLSIELFQDSAPARPAEMLETIHRGIRATRGASALIAALDLEARALTVCGIGNIAGVIVSDGNTQHLVSMNGTLGHQLRAFKEFSYPWNGSSLLILHSDGVSSRWDLNSYPGLSQKSLSLIAGVLYRDRVRERDDATVVAARGRRDR